MARKCGVCDRAPREGEQMHPIRLARADVKGKEEGLYHACHECTQGHKQRIAKRRGKAPREVSFNDLT